VRLRNLVSELCLRFNVERLLIEDAASGTQLIQLLRQDRPNHVPLPIACTPVGDKVTRFAAQASKIEGGELLLPHSASWLADLEIELIGFPNARYDDQADAISQLLRHPPLEDDSIPVGGILYPDPDEYDEFEELPYDPLY
jgi:predicted phage terminase large subunit-like protein